MKYCEFIYQIQAIEMAALIVEKPGFYTEAELAVRLNTSAPTIRRYKRYLVSIGIPVYSRKRFYYIDLNQEQLNELISRYRALSTREPVRFLRTISANLKEKTLSVFVQVIKAINRKNEIEIYYRKNKEDCKWRVILPLMIYQTTKAIYLIAVEHQQQKFFLFDHILEFRFPGRKSSMKSIPDLTELFSHTWGVFNDGRKLPVRLLFDLSLQDYLSARVFQEGQTLCVTAEGVELKMNVPMNYEFISWVMGWGRHVRVLAPNELKEEIIRRARDILVLYGRQK